MCNTTNTYLAYPTNYSFVCHIVSLIGAPIQFYGVYCLLLQSTESMKSVKWSLFNLHLWVMVQDYGTSILVTPFMMYPSMIGAGFGVFHHLNFPVLVDSFFLMFAVIFMSAAVLYIYKNRYSVLFNQTPISKWVLRILTVHDHTTGIFILLGSVFFYPANQEISKERIFREELPCEAREFINDQVYVILDDPTYALITFPLFGSMVFIEGVVLISLIIYKLISRSRESHFSQNTLRIQNQFILLTIIQTTVPVLAVLVPYMYAVYSVTQNYYNQGLNNLSFTIMSSHGIFGTIVMIYIHKAYREFTLRVVFRIKGKDDRQFDDYIGAMKKRKTCDLEDL